MALRDRLKKVFESKESEGIVEADTSQHGINETELEDNESTSKNVLFVCPSNTTISPIAAAIFNQKVSTEKALSAGLNALAGYGTSENIIKVCKNHGIDLSAHKTINITDIPVDEMEVVLASTTRVRDGLKMKYPNSEIFTIREYAGGYDSLDISDPLGDGLKSYEKCFRQIDEAISRIVDDLGEAIKDEAEIPHEDDEIIAKPVQIKGFQYLDDLIHSGEMEIVLDSDILLDDLEELKYKEGIELDVSSIVIDGNGYCIDARNMVRIFKCSAWNVTIKNITLTNGFSSNGGAIHNGGSLKIADSTIVSNMADMGGGAIYNDGTLTIENSTVEKNRASAGGGINNNFAKLTVIESVMDNNVSNFSGGAIKNEHGEVSIIESEFGENGTQRNGGALDNGYGEVSIEKSIFTKNTASEEGGAISSNRSMKIDGSDFFMNTAGENGGAINNTNELSLANSSFGKNTAQKNGGAIFSLHELRIESSTFSENVAWRDGGAIGNSRQLTVEECEFSKNTSRNHGGAISNNGTLTTSQSSFIDNTSAYECMDIFNSEIVYINKSDSMPEINGDVGKIYILESEKDEWKDFAYLRDLINTQNSEITLEYDVLLNVGQNEGELYAEGIRIERDVVIDGAGHTIDAQGLARIFFTSGGKVTLRNITFKNGFSTGYGGAIYNEKDCILEISGCRFITNASDDGGGAIYSDGKVTFNGCRFEKNTAKSNGGAILYAGDDSNVTGCKFCANASSGNGGAIFYTRGNLKVDECRFCGNSSKGNGGAICNFADGLDISDSTLANNTAENNGGAIYNANSIMLISKSAVRDNLAERFGGAIYDQSTKTTIDDSKICHNEAGNSGAALYATRQLELPTLKILQSVISDNKSPNDIVLCQGYLESYNVKFNSNESKNVLVNDYEDYNVTIFAGEFAKNICENAAILNKGHSMSIQETVFENNLSDGDNIVNKSNLTLISPKINDSGKTILNEGYVLLQKSLEPKSKIRGDGTVEDDLIPEDERFDFGYLDRLIRKSKSSKIVLTEDIRFENYERNYFEGGIELDIDGLVIDGGGHTIDGAGKSRIFVVGQNNITLKNIIFKNGHTHKNFFNERNACGGAIKVICAENLKIDNCQFIDNISEKDGGAIDNASGDLALTDSKFTNNTARHDGGGINSTADLDICRTDFNENTSRFSGGAICIKSGKASITDSILSDNCAESGGGAIENCSKLTIRESMLLNNICEGNGGAIMNFKDGELNIFKSQFDSNSASTRGGAIFNSAELTDLKSEFLKNSSQASGAAIYNSGLANITASTLSENKAQTFGGAIHNKSGELTMSQSRLENNSTDEESEAMLNDGLAKMIDISLANNDVYNKLYLIVKGELLSNRPKPIENHRYVIMPTAMTDMADNHGQLIDVNGLIENQKDFTYLNDLIHTQGNEIILENDIVLNMENGEDETFRDGIPIERDLTIDGAGHTIDAQGLARIFTCRGRHVTLKNIALKNGFTPTQGGAICNRGQLEISNSRFMQNIAIGSGGAISNYGRLTVGKSELIKNVTCSDGGAINNNGDAIVEKSEITQNAADVYGGAINNRKTFNIIDSTLSGNCGFYGGAIYDWDNLTISYSKLDNNTATNGKGGAIYLSNHTSYKSNNCIFKDNKPHDCY